MLLSATSTALLTGPANPSHQPEKHDRTEENNGSNGGWWETFLRVGWNERENSGGRLGHRGRGGSHRCPNYKEGQLSLSLINKIKYFLTILEVLRRFSISRRGHCGVGRREEEEEEEEERTENKANS